MEWVSFMLLFVIMSTQYTILEKIKKMSEKEKKNNLDLKEYLNKDVYIVLDNEDVTDSYLFSSITKTMGKILDFDETWIIFSYYNKSKRKNINQYFRISDIKSINIIQKN